MTSAIQNQISLRILPSPPPWQALLFPVGSFPVDAARVPEVRTFLQQFTEAAAHQWDLSLETFLQFWRLRKGDAASRYSANAAKWLTDLGLGIWPDRRPPAMWTPETFMDACAGDEPPVLMHKLFRITAAGMAPVARDVMLGCGTVLQILTPGDSQEMLAKTRDAWLEFIEDTCFRSFRFYIPLLEGKAVAAATASQLTTWLGGAVLYIRESIEDGGILIVSTKPLHEILENLKFEQNQEDAEWRIPTSRPSQ